jgi:phosphopantetheinyl transferase
MLRPSRRIEWLAARICLKELLMRGGLVSDPRDCELQKDERGRPWLAGLSDPTLAARVDCSLSHQGHWACACVTTDPEVRVGVDIESVSPRLERLAEMFVTDRDRPSPKTPRRRRLAILWTLKEAASKAVGLGIGVGLSEVVCRALGGGRHELEIDARGARLSAWHYLYEDFVIAVALMLRPSHALGVATSRTLV